MSFEIRVVAEFAASHQLRLYDGSLEPLHGHNWRVELTVGSPRLDSIGVVMDFHELQKRLEEIIGPMQNRHLNDLAAFDSVGGLNPSAENVALHIARSLKLPAGVHLVSVAVWEARGCCAIYRP